MIPNFIDLDKEKKDPNTPCHRSVMAAADERIITHISNFRGVKRIPDVVKIFYKIQKEDIMVIFDDISLEPGKVRFREK